jgi:hypothetical protein
MFEVLTTLGWVTIRGYGKYESAGEVDELMATYGIQRGGRMMYKSPGVKVKQAFQWWTSDENDDWRVVWRGGKRCPAWLQMPFQRKGLKHDLVYMGAVFVAEQKGVWQDDEAVEGVWCVEIGYLHPDYGLRSMKVLAQLIEFFLKRRMLVLETMVHEESDEVVTL